jgi:uncharacterized glyoxalase superfamily protein PhnB
MSELPDIYPVYRFRNGRAGIDHLKAAFGFETHVEYAEGDVVHHAELKLGNGFVMIAGAGQPDPNNPWNTPGVGTYAFVSDVDAHYERAKAAGAEIVMEIRDTEYGSREYSTRDVEGNLWSFGNYRPQV